MQFLHPPGPDHFLNRRAAPSSRSMFLLRCFVIFLVYLAGFYVVKQLLLQPPITRTLTKGESWVLQPNAYLFWQLHFFGKTQPCFTTNDIDPTAYTSTYIFDAQPKVVVGGNITLIETEVTLPRQYYKAWHRLVNPFIFHLTRAKDISCQAVR